MTRTLRISLAALLAVVLAATGVMVASASPTATKKKAPTLGLRKTSLGKVLVDSRGRTLYAFGHDLTDKSRCTGACASNWPPAKSPAKPTVAKGISKSKLKVIKRSDGSRQLSYAGHPLYRFVGDSKPGAVNGDGITAFGGTWHALAKTGAAASRPSSTTGGGGANPYGPYPGY